MASGGVRLYEANPAEHALARALAALLDLRAAGTRVLALGVGDVFGGCRCSPARRIALPSFPEPGSVFPDPRVIELAHGRGELDADDDAAITALFGAEARAAAGEIDLVADDATIVRAWIASALRNDSTFEERVRATQLHLCDALVRRP